MSGSVVLVGAGPGDAELMTLKAVRILQSADVVLYDALVSQEALQCVHPEAEKIKVGKRGYGAATAQAEINALMLQHARAGKRVVRLKGGDPAIFGRASEEITAIRAAGVPVEIVPGVTAAQAAAAALGVPLTDRDHACRLQYVTAHGRNGGLPEQMDWKALADPNATTVVYMPKQHMQAFAANIQAHGLPPSTPAVAVMDAARPTQRVISGTVADLPAKLAAAEMDGPVTVLIGMIFQEA